ncbi:MAG: MarR family transcriptional regulator [Flavobacterium sp.]
MFSCIARLSKKNNAVTQVDIANQSNADRMMVSKVLRTLEEKGFITPQERETDTRDKTIRLTSDGGVVLQKVLIEIENTDLQFFATLDSKLSAFNKNMANLIDKNSE